jgi:peptidoglycan hydrolase-like protein with peptidoglycan-binding domain
MAQTFLQGVLQGAGQLQQLKQQKENAELKKQQLQSMTEAGDLLKQYQQSVQSGAPNQELLVQATLKSPDLANQVLGAMGVTDKIQLDQAAADSAELWQLKDNPQAFMGKLAQRANSILERGGNPQDTIELATLYQQDPQAALMQLKSGAAALEAKGYKTGVFDGVTGQKSTSQMELEEYKRLLKEDPELAKQYGMKTGFLQTGREESKTAQEKNLDKYNQLLAEGKDEQAKMFGRQSGLLSKEGMELSGHMQKRLSDASDSAVNAERLESKYNVLANDFDALEVGGGLESQWSEYYKDITGQQDAISELRREYNKVRGQEVVNNLPPGAASDTDIALALSGFPTDRASGQQVASFLRGLAKIKSFEKQFNEFKANYISENGSERGMLKVWKENQPEFTPRTAEDRKAAFIGKEQSQKAQPRMIGRFEIIEE